MPAKPRLREHLANMRIGYDPMSPMCDAPGDRRRFVGYAHERGISFEIADPDEPYDLVVLSQRADFSKWLRHPYDSPIVFDFIDSYMAAERHHPRHLLRGTAKFVTGQYRHLRINHWRTLREMCRRSSAVLCSTAEQAETIRPYCHNVHRILDLHENEVAPSKSSYVADAPFRLLWEGLPENVATFGVIARILRTIHEENPLHISLVTDPTYPRFLGARGRTSTARLARRIFERVPFRIHPWSPTALSEAASGADLAVIPIPLENGLYRGKPENKLLILWRLGLPVLASGTPAYNRAMAAAGVPGACENATDWATQIRRLIRSQTAREQNARSGLSYVQQTHNTPSLLEQWDAAILSALSRPPASRDLALLAQSQ